MDTSLISEILERGVEKVYPSREALDKALRAGKPLTFYAGFDPSAASLHLGNAIQLAKLAQLQKAGHKVIFVAGDFTGMIGDPTDKAAARKQLDRTIVKQNIKQWKKQASSWLEFSGRNSAEFKQNSKWYDKLSLDEFIRLTANFTVQQMLVRDMFQERIKAEKPIYVHEFLYPILQGYDSVALEVDGEVGGNDQTFNMLAGRELAKSLAHKEKFVITTKLLVDGEGKKMGKTTGNIVNLDETPENMYGAIMAWPDEIMPLAFELCTKRSWTEVKEVQKRLKTTNLNPRDFKMKLAHEITSIYHGAKKADAAEEYFVKTIQKKEVPDEVTSISTDKSSISLVDALVETGLAPSKSAARRLVEQGGVKVDGEVAIDAALTLELSKEGVLLQKGKREYRRLCTR